ncbi:MAG: MotA/TolQ/ExbB proton channel family protein [Woeseiaceae bacterium]
MLVHLGTSFWLLSVAAAATLQLTAPGSGVIAVFAGLWLVVGGTMLIARISNSSSVLMLLGRCVRNIRPRRFEGVSGDAEFKWFYEAASLFRYGNIRPAEEAAQRIPDPFLRHGTQLVLDGFPREQVMVALQRQIADDRDQFRRPVDLLVSMSGYAPTLGMLGTLLGLVQMLFGLSAGNLETVGASMGFGMLTTVYGLVLANLVFKPLANKLEQTGRDRIAQTMMHLQAITMLHDREHSVVIREVMGTKRPRWTNGTVAMPLATAASH